MSLTEQTRLRLHRYFEEHMDRELANEVMEWLPRGELATKDDIEALRLATKADIEALRVATEARIEGLRAEMLAEFAGLRAEMLAEFAGLRAELKADIAGLRAELKADIAGLRAEFVSAGAEHAGLHEALVARIEVSGEKLRLDMERTLRVHTMTLFGAIGVLATVFRIF